jgi:hypothetical protein
MVPPLVVALVGLAIGIGLGMPGRDRPSVEDIERAMDKGGSRRRSRGKRTINPLAWVQRKAQAKPTKSGRQGFKLESPDEREQRR